MAGLPVRTTFQGAKQWDVETGGISPLVQGGAAMAENSNRSFRTAQPFHSQALAGQN